MQRLAPLVPAMLVLLLLLLGSRLPAIEVGAAVRSIDPETPLPVSGGLGAPRPVRSRRGDLTARALVLTDGDVRVAVVSLDLLGFPSVLCDRVRSRIEGIPPGRVLIGSTHTHSAPDVYAFPDGRGGHTADLAYIDRVVAQTAGVVEDAIRRLGPATLRIATGEVRGRVAYNYYAPDLYDRRASVIQAVAPDGGTVATLVNYAVHPEVLGADAGVSSPDLVGPLCQRIERKAGGVALFMNGAQGGMVTADNRDLDHPTDPVRGTWRSIQTWDECVRIGETLADEALRIVGAAPLQKAPRLTLRSRTVELPVESDLLWSVILHSPLRYPHVRGKRAITTRIDHLIVGNAHILTIPGEALPNIGFYLKRRMRGEHNLLFGLTNDALGYILTEVDFGSFPRYEYISRTSLGPRTGPLYLDAARSLIGEAGDGSSADASGPVRERSGAPSTSRGGARTGPGSSVRRR